MLQPVTLVFINITPVIPLNASDSFQLFYQKYNERKCFLTVEKAILSGEYLSGIMVSVLSERISLRYHGL